MGLAVFLYAAIDAGIHDRIADSRSDSMTHSGRTLIRRTCVTRPDPSTFSVLVADAGSLFAFAASRTNGLNTARLGMGRDAKQQYDDTGEDR
jgi:hypothetical protein